ncbi:MAG: 30S ribosomal protein S13 [Parcubacteria group bacterium]|nr:30S ribosomal protein S13 [Parcubacteria group bacterium]MBI4217219.1 30S ribosomal protein S13 [Parcubacteria group bacterium]
MVRLLGIQLPDNKRADIALGYLYGVGAALSRDILRATRIAPETKMGKLTSDELNRVKEYVEKNHKIEGELRREILMNVKRLKAIGSWRGMRHARGLPVRGQRTKTNTRTVRGNVRKTVGSGRKPAATPT